MTQDGLPLIGAIPGARGAYVATGHSVWGILNAPATGEAMAELILDGATRAGLAAGLLTARRMGCLVCILLLSCHAIVRRRGRGVEPGEVSPVGGVWA